MVDWDIFDSAAYVTQNYRSEIQSEDVQVIRFVVAELRRLQVPLGTLRLVADIGAGPNLYPGLLLTPFVRPGGTLEFIDRSAANLRYLCDTIEGRSADIGVWRKFEHFLRESGHHTSLRKLQDIAVINSGDILDLPVSRYEAITCFFVAESITSDRDVFAANLDSLMRSLKPGGLFVTAHMVGSRGYEAGPSYPSCDLTMPEIENAYEPYGIFRSALTSHSPGQAVRPGYAGMAALVGRRHS